LQAIIDSAEVHKKVSSLGDTSPAGVKKKGILSISYSKGKYLIETLT